MTMLRLVFLALLLVNGEAAFQQPLGRVAVIPTRTSAFVSRTRPLVPPNRRDDTVLFMSSAATSTNSTNEDGSQQQQPASVETENQVEQKQTEQGGSGVDLTKLAIQGGVVVVSLIVLFSVASSLMTAATGMASSAAGALGDEILREFASLASLLFSVVVAILTATWKGLTIAVPAIVKGLYSFGQAAAPVVQKSAQSLGEAASPYVDETTARISEAAAPYVDQMNSAVDSQIVKPAMGAIDANVVAPLKGATDSVTNAVDSTIKGATESVTTAVDSTIKGATDTVTNSVNAKINELNDALTTGSSGN